MNKRSKWIQKYSSLKNNRMERINKRILIIIRINNKMRITEVKINRLKFKKIMKMRGIYLFVFVFIFV